MSTVAEQADEVGREVRQRERLYPDWITRGRIKPDTADRKIETLRDAERTLRFISHHAAGRRALSHFLLASPPGAPPIPTEDEKQALLAHPAVKALLEVWPDAEVSILGPAPAITPPSQDDLFAREHEDA